MDELLKIKFTNKKGNVAVQYKNIFNKLSENEQEFLNLLYPEYDDIYSKLKSLILLNDYRRCTICNIIIPWNTRTTCSKECYLKLHNNTCLEKYGNENYFNSSDFQKKREDTNLEKYGVIHHAQSDIVRNKTINTNKERYGVDNPMQCEEIKEKGINTNKERYGVDNYFKHSDFNEKRIKTNLEKYGVTHQNKNKEIKDKIKQKLLEKKIKFVKDKIGYDITYKEADMLAIDINYNYSIEYLNAIVEDIKGIKKINENDIFNSFTARSTIDAKLRENNIEINKSCKSNYEFEISTFLNNLNIDHKNSVRNVIKPFELDIYIPSHNIAIEFNGDYYHREERVGKYYHQMKTKLCNEKGITLIHIHEYLYKCKSEIYKNIIKSKLKLNEKVYARKCILKEVTKQEEKDFLDSYHLQGFVGSSKCYGLYKDDKLLTLCSFGKSRFNKKYEYELLRNCTKPNITVVGGLSKIIKYYKLEINNKPIICYSDASISYNKNSDLTIPNYVWVKQSIVYRRYQTMKHKLEKILGIKYNNTKTEDENMINNGFIKIYDSGNYITIY